MSEKTEIESWVKCQLAELTSYGFSDPVIKREDWSTVVDWLGTDIALELELDWREFNVFLLVVKLEDGRLPQGYYVSNGKPCRFHLQKVIKEKGWHVSSETMNVLSSNGKRGYSQKPSADKLRHRVLAYKAVLMSCITQLLIDHKTIFTG